MALLDDVISRSQAGIDEVYTQPEPTLTEQKEFSIENKYQEKKSAIEPATIAYQPDADTTVFTDGVTLRGDGRDNYETFHSDDYLDEEGQGQRRYNMRKQKKRYSSQFGVPRRDVTDEMIHKQGAKENLMSMYKKVGSPKYKDPVTGEMISWEPEDLSEEWYTSKGGDEPASLGDRPTFDENGNRSVATPLDLVVGRKLNGDVTHGRSVGSEYTYNKDDNTYQQTSVDEQMTNQYNATVYDEDGLNKKATEDRRAELAGWQGTLPSKMKDREEKLQYRKWKNSDSGLYENAIDSVQASSANYLAKAIEGSGKLTGKVAGMIDEQFGKGAVKKYSPAGWATSAIEAIAPEGWLEEQDKKLAKITKENDNNFLGTGLSRKEVASNDKNILDQKFGVNKDARILAHALQTVSDEKWKNKDYSGSMLLKLDKLPFTIADSAGPMIGLMLPGGSVGFTASEMPEQEAAFKKANGRDMTNSEYLQTLAVTYGTTVLEKVLGKFGLEKLGDILKSKAGKSVLGKVTTGASGLVVATGLEIAQEASEGIRQEMTGRKLKDGEDLFSGKEAIDSLIKASQKPEVWSHAMDAGLSAGAMSATGITAAQTAKLSKSAVVATINAPGKILSNKEKKRQEDVGEYLVGEDADFAGALEEMSFQDTQKWKEDTKNSTETIDNYNSVEEMLESENPEIRRAARNLEKEAGKEVETGSQEHRKNISRKFANEGKHISTLEGQERIDAQGYVDSMKDILGIDITESSKNEILEAIETIEDTETKKYLYDNMTAKDTKPTATELAGDYTNGFEGYRSKIKESLEVNDKLADMAIDQKNDKSKNFNEGQKRAPKEKTVETGEETYSFTHALTGENVNGKVIDVTSNGVKTVEYTDENGNRETATFDKDGNGMHGIGEIGSNKTHSAGSGTMTTKKVSGFKGGDVNAKKIEKKTKKTGLARLVDAITLNNTGKKDAIRELNKYTPEALESALKDKDTSPRMKVFIKHVQNKRRTASSAGKMNKDTNIKIRGNNLKKGDKKGTVDFIHDVLVQKGIYDTRDVAAMEGVLESALEQGFINEKQKLLFEKRLKKISEDNAVAPTDELLDAEQESKEKFKEETGLGDKTAENLNEKTEITKEDLEEEVVELKSKVSDIQSAILRFDEISKIPEKDRTKAQKKELLDKEKKIDAYRNRSEDVKKQLKNFTKQETKTNESHSVLEEEWFYEDATEYNGSNIEEAFSEEEKKILGIC